MAIMLCRHTSPWPGDYAWHNIFPTDAGAERDSPRQTASPPVIGREAPGAREHDEARGETGSDSHLDSVSLLWSMYAPAAHRGGARVCAHPAAPSLSHQRIES